MVSLQRESESRMAKSEADKQADEIIKKWVDDIRTSDE
jgi:hypothetical protein